MGGRMEAGYPAVTSGIVYDVCQDSSLGFSFLGIRFD